MFAGETTTATEVGGAGAGATGGGGPGAGATAAGGAGAGAAAGEGAAPGAGSSFPLVLRISYPGFLHDGSATAGAGTGDTSSRSQGCMYICTWRQ